MLRPYQQHSLDQLYAWFSKNPDGNPCLVLPTGSGKSHIIAALVKDAVQSYPDTRILMLTHSKELITQNLEKLKQHWSDAPVGVYSASLKSRDLNQAITYAAIQSVRNKAAQIGHISLCIVDEAHAINHAQTGGYRRLMKGLLEINPDMRVVGLTASPYRLGHGMIHQGDDVLFDAIIEPVSIEELVNQNYLAPLRSKHTQLTYDTNGIRKSAGDFVASAIAAIFNTDDTNEQVVQETIKRAHDRKSWLIFCATVDHANEMCRLFNEQGIATACVTGGTPLDERDDIIRRFKCGEIRAITNVNVLTTGFDHTGIDCIVFLRPTMSPGLYYQMAGRGLRVDPCKTDCLVLDFAGNVSRHGPITAIQPPRKGGNGSGEMATKACPECQEVVLITARECPNCAHVFKPKEDKNHLVLHDDDIMGFDPIEMNVTGWAWRTHKSRTSGKDMLKATYYGNLSDQPIVEYFPVTHDGYAGEKARQNVASIANQAGVDYRWLIDMEFSAKRIQSGTPPAVIKFKRDGKFFRVLRREWPT